MKYFFLVFTLNFYIAQQGKSACAHFKVEHRFIHVTQPMTLSIAEYSQPKYPKGADNQPKNKSL
jgi:hypothetical protein